jgi:hypothetical protein
MNHYEGSKLPFSLVNEASDPSEVPVGQSGLSHFLPGIISRSESQNWTKEASLLPEVFEDPSPEGNRRRQAK